jgi:hypothetical protein
MVLPFVMSASKTLSAASHQYHSHMTPVHPTVAGADAMAVVIHTLAYLSVMTLAAWGVYRKLGLSLLRTAWINLDWVWAGALVITGIAVMLR